MPIQLGLLQSKKAFINLIMNNDMAVSIFWGIKTDGVLHQIFKYGWLQGAKSKTHLSSEMAAKVSAEAVAVSVDAGHKTRHINAPYGHRYPLSSSTKSKGMLRRGVRRSQALKFSNSVFEGAWRRRRLQEIKYNTKLLPTELNVKITK